MKIGFDAKRANANNTGLGNYSRFVIEALAENAAENAYTMYVPKRKSHPEYDVLRQDFPFLEEKCAPNKIFSALWRSFFIGGDLKRDGIEIFHGLSGEIPCGLKSKDVKSVVTIHDLIFLRYPQLYKPFDRWIYDKKARYACENADHIIAVSEQTKRDIIEFYGTKPERISVIYQGCAPQFAKQESDERKAEVRANYSLPERFLLNVGTLEERKNLGLIVEALALLPEDVHLVACGRATPYSQAVMQRAEELGVRERVHLIHGVKYRDLPVLNQMADVVLYPSRFEGFGIPIIEALSGGAPVVAATGSCLEEAGGDAALYVSPDDEKALAKAVIALCDDENLRAQCREKGLAHVEKFRKSNIAAQINALYMRILSSEIK